MNKHTSMLNLPYPKFAVNHTPVSIDKLFSVGLCQSQSLSLGPKMNTKVAFNTTTHPISVMLCYLFRGKTSSVAR